MEALSPVTLVVKAPNQKIADQTIECGLGWTIKKLKEHLSNVYPNKPRETHQKLIYSGKLLNDNLILKDVLRQFDEDQTTHTVHLVCSPLPHEYSQTNYMEHSSSPAPEASSPSPQVSAPSDGLRHRTNHSPEPVSMTTSEATPPSVPVTTAVPVATPMGFPGAEAMQQMYGMNAMMYGGGMYPGMMAFTPEQMVAMQQMYTQQMAQFMQFYQGQAAMPTPPATPVMPANQHFNFQHPQPAPANENAAQPAPAANRRPGADQPIRMNAQGGPVLDDDDEEGGQRDWLDWIYTLSRFSVLLSILYFYSSFSRFVMVFGCFVLVYMYQAGWFTIRRNRGNQDNNNNNQQQQPAAQQQQQDQQQQQPEAAAEGEAEGQAQQQVEEADDASPEGGATEEAAPTEPVAPPRPGAAAVAWSFFTTFFSSLIPQQPPAVNAN